MAFLPFWPKNCASYTHVENSAEFLKKILQNHPEILANLPPAIYFSGTNGKGSTLSFTKSILEDAGFSVHAYTSPHLIHYNERIVLNGKMITDAFAQEVLEEARLIMNGKSCTFFEGMTLAAFIAFSHVKADFLLLEVGMGGLKDATNVLTDALLSVITSISFDHTEFLGNTVEEIALEKAGIIFENRACVVAKQQFQEVHPIIQGVADEKNSSTFFCDFDWYIDQNERKMIFQDENEHQILDLPSLAGYHQVENAGTAIKTILELKNRYNYEISWKNIENGLKNTYWPARLEAIKGGFFNKILQNKFKLFVDGAHNAGAAAVLADWIDKQSQDVFLIFGTTRGKDVKPFFEQFLPCANLKMVGMTCVMSEYNAYTKDEIEEMICDLSLQNKQKFNNVYEAIEYIIENENRGIILVCGSLYLYSDVNKIKNGYVL